MLVLMSDPDSHPLIETLARGVVSRNINRDYNLWKQIITGTIPDWRISDAGLAIEGGYRVPFDSDRFCRSIDKIVRGLFYYKSHVPLPVTHKVEVHPGNGFWKADGIQDYLNSMSRPAGVGDDVFQCRCVQDGADSNTTGWLLVFYRNVSTLAHTIRRDLELGSK